MTAVGSGVRGGVIVGWGTALPDKVLTNADLETMMDTDDQWIRERTGIHERRVGGTTASLSVEAGRAALDMAGVGPDEIDALILATTTPDRAVPATASTVQDQLGLRCGAFDVNAACSGFVYGLVQAHGMIALGAKQVLLIGTDTLSRITDWSDRNTGVLFADGSGAVVVRAVPDGNELVSWHLDSDGAAEEHLMCEHGGTLQMDGREIFRRAVRVMVDSAQRVLADAGLTVDDLALVVPHQANTRIINAALDRLGIEHERASVVLHRTGNTSSASVPLALADALDAGRVAEGDHVLVVGFAAGMTSAAAIVKWAPSLASAHTTEEVR